MLNIRTKLTMFRRKSTRLIEIKKQEIKKLRFSSLQVNSHHKKQSKPVKRWSTFLEQVKYIFITRISNFAMYGMDNNIWTNQTRITNYFEN